MFYYFLTYRDHRLHLKRPLMSMDDGKDMDKGKEI